MKFMEPHEASHKRIASMDDDVRDFIRNITENNKDALIILSSDHGVGQGQKNPE
jgi:predicted AlkP superfamily pyrophosphatase or phosphodiesterase